MNRPKCTYDGECLDQSGNSDAYTCGTMAECRYKRAEPDVGEGYECVGSDTVPYEHGLEIQYAKDNRWYELRGYVDGASVHSQGAIFRRPKRAEPDVGKKRCCDCVRGCDSWPQECIECFHNPHRPNWTPKRPALPDGYEWVPESVAERPWDVLKYPKPHMSGWSNAWHDNATRSTSNLNHRNFWYCRPVKPDCDAEFEKWWGGDRGKLCHLCQGIPCDTCKQMSREVWRAARGQ